MLPSVEAHTQVLCEDDVFVGIFITVLFVQLPDISPTGRAVFLTGALVLIRGIIKNDSADIQQQSAQHEFDSVRCPMQRKGGVHRIGKDGHELKEIHAGLINACCQRSQIENEQGEHRPHRGGLAERFTVYIGIPPKSVSP